jgi:RHS repeat-associated protein
LIGHNADGTTTAYLGSDEVTETGTVLHDTRYYSGNAIRTATGLVWSIADPHGSGEIAVNATTLAVTHRRLDPFGNPRNAGETWPTNKGFLNDTADPTGTTHIGAREYDSTVGRFATRDPKLETGSPQQLNGYSYAGNDPTSACDPSGLMAREDVDTGSLDDGHVDNYSANPNDGPSSSSLGPYQASWSVKHPEWVSLATDSSNLAKKQLKVAEARYFKDTGRHMPPGMTNAFRHSLWMALMTSQGMPAGIAADLGMAHEKDGDKPGSLLGSPDSNTDLHNNEVGRLVGVEERSDFAGFLGAVGISSVSVDMQKAMENKIYSMTLYEFCDQAGALDVSSDKG